MSLRDVFGLAFYVLVLLIIQGKNEGQPESSNPIQFH